MKRIGMLLALLAVLLLPCGAAEKETAGSWGENISWQLDTQPAPVPKTGDNGTMMFTIVGILLMVGAAVVLYAVSSKKSA